MILLSDEEWDITDLKNAFGSGKTTRDKVISKVHEVYDQVHFVCVRKALNQFFNRKLWIDKGSSRSNSVT